MKSPIQLLASIDLRKIPDETLDYMAAAIEAERVKRAGQRKRTGAIFSSVYKRIKGKKIQGRSQEDLFLKEWDAIYPKKDDEKPRHFYVYAHVKPDIGCIDVKTSENDFIGIRIPGVPFYIGKGCGDRAFDLNRNQGHGEEIRSLLKTGVRPNEIAQILVKNLSEAEALKIESKLIYFFGTRYEPEIDGILVNLDKPPRPEILDKPRIAQ